MAGKKATFWTGGVETKLDTLEFSVIFKKNKYLLIYMI